MSIKSHLREKSNKSIIKITHTNSQAHRHSRTHTRTRTHEARPQQIYMHYIYKSLYYLLPVLAFTSETPNLILQEKKITLHNPYIRRVTSVGVLGTKETAFDRVQRSTQIDHSAHWGVKMFAEMVRIRLIWTHRVITTTLDIYAINSDIWYAPYDFRHMREHQVYVKAFY